MDGRLPTLETAPQRLKDLNDRLRRSPDIRELQRVEQQLQQLDRLLPAGTKVGVTLAHAQLVFLKGVVLEIAGRNEYPRWRSSSTECLLEAVKLFVQADGLTKRLRRSSHVSDLQRKIAYEASFTYWLLATVHGTQASHIPDTSSLLDHEKRLVTSAFRGRTRLRSLY